ncbi:MAG TPA: hypothetical protein VHW47_10210 [Acidimicrobiales bacterium]|jgi:hypothetical protein|nr:hypothetical protein [Acidimicrobiales bacterium]
MLAEQGFFSFAEVTDPARHADYNRWHQLDHRPENLLLEGVRYGERWVRTPACIAASRVDDERLAGTHYVNLYWFRSPAAASIVEWQELAERSFQWGRRPEGEWTVRPLMGFFTVIKGYASPRVLVSADALPFRPNRGVQVTVSRLADPHGNEAARRLAWHDQERIPGLLELDGVAGVWTFSSISTTIDPSWQPAAGSVTFDAAGNDRASLRVTVAFLDEDPIETSARIDDQDRSRSGLAGDPDAETILFSSPLRAITPWEWDWFDRPA